MKKAPCLGKSFGAFLFRVVLKLKLIGFSVYRQPSLEMTSSVVVEVDGEAEEPNCGGHFVMAKEFF